MTALAAFWRQPCRRYRDFQLVFTVLTLNFVVPALVYTFAPRAAVEQFMTVNRLLGGDAYDFPEAASRLWRYLGAANVMTLGLMCLLLQLDLRRFYSVLVPLTFMKAYAAACWLSGWVQAPGYRLFLAAAVLDTLTSAAFIYFARSAYREITRAGAPRPIPSPGGGRS
jgi:hypothetical protein